MSDQRREEMLTEVIHGHGKRLLSLIRSRIRDQIEAEDILQEVFAEFLQAYDLGQTIERLGGWLMTVARNKALDRFRRRKTEREHVIAASNTDSVESEEWTRSWLRAEIVEAIELLPEEQRQVFVLHELEGMSFEQIASQTGVPLNTLLSRKRYAVANLRTYLKEIYDELES